MAGEPNPSNEPPRSDPAVLRGLMVTGYLWGGGAEWHLLNLTWSLRKMGVHVDVAYVLNGTKDAVTRWREYGIEPIRLRCPLRIARLARGQYDLVHAHLFKGELAATIVARVLRLPLVVTRHSMDWANLPAWQRALLATVVHRRTRGMIAISQAVAAVCRTALAGRDVPVRVIPHGIAAELLLGRSLGTDIRKELGLEGRQLIGTAARLSEDKGLAHLLHAYRIAQQALADWHVVIAGDGPQRVPLEKLARDLGISDRVHILGWREDSLDIVRALDIFTLPSVREGFGLALLEAMTFGAAAVVSDLPAIRQTADQAALYVPPADPDQLAQTLTHLARNPTLRDDLKARSTQQAAKFSAETMAKDTLAFYATVVTR